MHMKKKGILDNIKAVIFDLDGTLVDSMWMWKDIDIEYLGKYHLSLPESLQQDIEGMSFTETAAYFKENFALPRTLEEIKQDWMDMAYEKYRYHVPLKPGAGHFLEDMHSRDIRMGIATSNGRGLVDAVLEARKLGGYFHSVCTACEVAKGKPSPDIYLKVASDLDVKPENCLVFEDIPMGILAGKNAGMSVCAVEDEFSAHQRDKKRAWADYYIETYDDIYTNTYEVLGNE
ncbi:HAD family phosphatase [Murimonas intestini]|uniref:HAD family hydrolase n=1 Tax=Murimonas intestini TaxID=1337051 RepID=UPI002ED358B1